MIYAFIVSIPISPHLSLSLTHAGPNNARISHFTINSHTCFHFLLLFSDHFSGSDAQWPNMLRDENSRSAVFSIISSWPLCFGPLLCEIMGEKSLGKRIQQPHPESPNTQKPSPLCLTHWDEIYICVESGKCWNSGNNKCKWLLTLANFSLLFCFHCAEGNHHWITPSGWNCLNGSHFAVKNYAIFSH